MNRTSEIILRSEKEISELLKTHAAEIKEMFGKNILFLRYLLGFMANFEPYTQKEFCNKIGVSLATLKNWETGRNLPSLLALERTLLFIERSLGKDTFTTSQILLENLSKILAKKVKPTPSKIMRDEHFKFDFLSRIVDHGVLIASSDQILFANEYAHKIYEYKPGKLIGLNPFDIVVYPTKEQNLKRWSQSTPGKLNPPVTLKVLSEKGRIIAVSAESTAITHLGKPAMLIVSRKLGKKSK